MNEELEKMESIEQVLEVMVSKFVDLEVSVKEVLQLEVPNYRTELKDIHSVLDFARRNYEAKALGEMVKKLELRMEQVPERTLTHHHHHLEFKTKFQLLGALSVFLGIALAVGLSVSLLVRNNELRAEADCFKVVRAYYPSLAKSVYKAYLNDRARLMKDVDSMLSTTELKAPNSSAHKRKR